MRNIAIFGGMRGRIKLLITCCFLFTLATGCVFGRQPFRGVVSYRDGRVFLSLNQPKKFYRVGKLPGGWKRLKTPARAITFFDSGTGSSISTDAFCGRSVGDQALSALGGEVISALDDRKVTEEVPFTLDGRAAVRQRVEGKFNGVPIVLDLVVVRKDDCVFDMYAIMPPDSVSATEGDFETFYLGFHYK